MTHSGFAIRAVANAADPGAKAIEIDLYDVIGRTWDGGLTAKDFVAELKKHPGAKAIVLNINSPGGDVFEGVAIYNALRRRKATITVNIDGMALSIASLIAMAGDEIHMAENAMIMIHDPWAISIGSAEELRDSADRLEKIAGTLVRTYAARSGQDPAAIAEMMAAETWLDAEDALAAGLATKITAAKRMAASARLPEYRNTPPDLLARLAAAEADDEAPPTPPPTPRQKTPAGALSASANTERNPNMSIETAAPDQAAVEAAHKAGAEEASARLKNLQAAFPADPAFALSAAADGLDVQAAKAMAYDRLHVAHAAALTAKDAELTAAGEKADKMAALLGSKGVSAADIAAFDPSDPAHKPTQGDGTGDAAANDTKTAAAFSARVEALIAGGLTPGNAYGKAGNELPEAHAAWVAAGCPL
ncbi:MAG TPA: head maturation protease, ClpP-related [Phycisphaerae bacterium]|nr:head maturation protease, ClpP-related [Phycisphaerae bacterium]